MLLPALDASQLDRHQKQASSRVSGCSFQIDTALCFLQIQPALCLHVECHTDTLQLWSCSAHVPQRLGT
jgi:hypothetical protein